MPPKTKATKPVETTPVPASVSPPPPVVVPVVEPVVKVETPSGPEVDLGQAYLDFMGKMLVARQSMTALIADFRVIQKRAEREMKAAQKSSHKRKNKNTTRAPSGFVKPTLISDNLAKFLNKPSGILLARTEVTREINAYIRANKLQDTSNGRKINPDEKLTALLSLKPTDELTYFNLQRYMSQHFKKAEPAATA